MSTRDLHVEPGPDGVTLGAVGDGVRTRRYLMRHEDARALADLLRAAADGTTSTESVPAVLPGATRAGEARPSPKKPERTQKSAAESAPAKPSHIPTPAQLRGNRPPAETVEPVDYTAAPPRRPAESPPAGSAPPTRPTRSAAESSGGEPPAPPAPPAQPAPPTSGATEPESPASKPSPGDVARRIHAASVGPPATPPDDALYTVDTGEAPPTAAPSPLVIPDGGVEMAGSWDAKVSDLERVVADPEETWTTDLGRTDYYLRGDLAVQVTRSTHTLVGVFPAGRVRARRPDPVEPIGQRDPGPAPRGGEGTRYPTTRRALLTLLKEAGFEVSGGKTHGKITHPDKPGPMIPLASSPSEQRYGRHVVTEVKRVFGIDLRERGDR